MPKRPDFLYFADIKQSCHYILESTKNLTLEDFSDNYIISAAVCKWLENIGEAANQLPEETKKKNPQIPWRKMIGMRNILIHVYHGCDLELVWNVCTNEIEDLFKKIEAIE